MRIETTVGLIVVVALIFSLGMYTLSNIQATQSAGTEAYNVTGQGISAFSRFADLLTPIIFIFVGAALIWGVSLLVKRGNSSL